ncbi:MAG: M4 family metallopeptidase [Acidobacteria bacterium]|nr:M4 family metallopeptidase [Acidobacteriota bacterium]
MHELNRFTIGALLLALLTVPTSSTAQPPVQNGVLRLSAGSGSALTALRDADALVNQLTRDESLRLVRQEGDPLVPGREHERLQQFHDGVLVFGAEVTRQTSQGLPVSVFGTVHLGIEVDTTPTLSADDAARIVEGLSGRTIFPTAAPKLVILPDRDAESVYRLVYEARAFTGAQLMVYFVDAASGALVWSYNDLKTQQPALPCSRCVIGEGIGVKSDRKKMSVTTVGGAFLAQDQLRPAQIFTFDMRGDLDHTELVLSGIAQLFDADLSTDTDNRWLDGASVDAHVGMGWTYDYLYKRFGRRSLNDQNVRLLSLVHPVNRADVFSVPDEVIGLYFLNAFYCGLCGPDGVGVAVFGEGLPPNVLVGGQQFDFFAGALDIVAHELAHGVTDFTSALLYMDESGALNEAFSDVIGVGAEFYAESLFRGGAGVPDYTLGEDVIEPGGIRSLANPLQFGDPDHYSLRFLGEADNGGVHTNSLIPGHAFFLAIEGGTNRVSGLSVAGVGAANRGQMEQVFYRAFTVLMISNADFAAARTATIQSARDLYGANSPAARAVTEAWTAVGVN